MKQKFGTNLMIALSWVLILSFGFVQDLNLQNSPTVALNATEIVLNEDLIIEGLHLTPGETYTLSVNNPEGDQVVTETLLADAEGNIRFSTLLDNEGIWQVAIRGEDMRAIFEVDVLQAVTESPDEGTAEAETSGDTSIEDAEADSAVDGGDETAEDSAENGDVENVDANTDAEDSDIAGDSSAENSDDNETSELLEEAVEASEETESTEEVTESQEDSVDLEASESETDSATEEVTEEASEPPALQEAAQSQEETSSQETSEEMGAEETATNEDATEPVSEATEESSEVTNETANEDDSAEEEPAPETSSVEQSDDLASPGDADAVINEEDEATVAESNEEGSSLASTTETESAETTEEEPASEGTTEATAEETAQEENTAQAEDGSAESAETTTEETESIAEESQVTEEATSATGENVDAETLQAAIATTDDFSELANMAGQLVAAGDFPSANEAMDKALQSFAGQGYDPRLLRDLDQHESYNFPLQPLQDAIESGNREEADFWANWARYFVSADVPQVGDSLRDYARWVAREDGRAAAREWRDAANAGRRTNLASVIDSFFSTLGRTGWYGVISLFIAVLSLHLTLWFKYWSPQSLFLRRQRDRGGTTSPLARIRVMRYYSTFEKLVLVLMFAAALLIAGLAKWNQQSETSLPVTTGNFADSSTALSSAELSGAQGSFIKGYAAHLAGDTASAEAAYLEAGDLPSALNNLGALRGDTALFEQAMRVSPNFPEAKYNLATSPEEQTAFLFQRDFLTGQPVLAVPSAADIQAATSGTWQSAVVRTFSNPWTALADLDPWSSLLNNRFPWFSKYLWYGALGLVFLWIAIHILWLFIPRPRLARNAPRNPLYQLFAVLIPGSGAADEMWGLLLLIPWAIVGVDILADIFNWGFGLGITRNWDYIILGIIYVINLAAVIVEYFSYRRRMTNLKRDNPDLAAEFGLN